MKLAEFNRLKGDAAVDALLSCCASRAWAEAVVARGPFLRSDDLLEAAETVWWQLPRVEWLMAFAAHPRIGERSEKDAWAAHEQAGVWGSEEAVRAELHQLNQLYEQRFGHVFLIFASGKSAQEMLAALKQRLHNDPETELQNAAAEQARITRLRLQRLIESTP